MPQNTHLEMIEADAERVPQGAKEAAPDTDSLRRNAEEVARRLAWNPGAHKSRFVSVRWNRMAAALGPVLEKVNRTTRNPSDPVDLRWLRDNMPLLGAELGTTRNAFKRLRRLPHVRTPRGTTIPRVAAVAEAFLHAVDFDFSESSFVAYLGAFQESTLLKFRELWALIPTLEFHLPDPGAPPRRKLL